MGTLDKVSSCQGVVGAENFDVIQGSEDDMLENALISLHVD
jgi:hypothetical protein